MTARMRLSRWDRGGRWTPLKLATAPNKSETNIARTARSGPNRGNQYRNVPYMYGLTGPLVRGVCPCRTRQGAGLLCTHARRFGMARHYRSGPTSSPGRWRHVVASVVAPLVALSGGVGGPGGGATGGAEWWRWWARWWPRCRYPPPLPARLDARCAFGTSRRAGQEATSTHASWRASRQAGRPHSPHASWGALAVSTRAVLHSLAGAALGCPAALLPITPRALFVAWTGGFSLCHCWPG
jgi:hypothetical protein